MYSNKSACVQEMIEHDYLVCKCSEKSAFMQPYNTITITMYICTYACTHTRRVQYDHSMLSIIFVAGGLKVH